MKIFWTCKTASRGCVVLAIIAMLLASAAAFSDDDTKKDKKKDSNTAKPAPVQKAPTGGGQPPASGAGKNERTTAPPKTGGETNTGGRSGGTSPRNTTGGTTTTNKTGETGTTDKGARRSGKSEGAGTTGKTGDPGSANKAGETSTIDKTGRKSGKSEGAGTTGKTGDPGSANKTGETSTTDRTGRRGPKTEGASTTGKTGDPGSANKTGETSTTDRTGRKSGKSEGASTTIKTGDPGTNKNRETTTTDKAGSAAVPAASSGVNKTGEAGTTDKAERKRARSEGVSTTGKTGDPGTVNKAGETSTTDRTGRRNAKGEGTNPTGKTGVTSTTGKNISGRPVITRTADGKPDRFRGRDGSEARFRRDGTVREVRARDMTIIHGPGGSRRIVVERVDHSRIVAYRGGHGYVQRPFLYRGHEYANRTYFYQGRPYARYYQRYPYRGVFLEGYRPYRYYGRSFYGWAYNPWRSPVRYSWGWAGNPWYGYYGGYFTPYVSYPSAAFWLTDYLIAASLQQAYQQRLDSQAAAFASGNSDTGVVLTPEVKQAIADEVQRQLALENAESQTVAGGGDVDINSSGLPRILAETSPNHPHIFVVAGPLEVTDAEGRDCDLTEGDVLRLSTAPPPDATYANLQVFASKNQSCPRGATVSVGLADLQEMQNHMRSSIDQGLQELQAHPNGLPAPPPGSATSVQASFAQIAPPADPNVASELQQQAREADTAEQGVLEEVKQDNVGDPNTTSKPPIEISLGQTIGEVEAALGNPTQIVNLGAKKIYVYPDLKITFIDGKVTDVQ